MRIIRHKDLTEAQAERLHDLAACAPLTYRPSIDSTLVAAGLARYWEPDEPEYGVEATPRGEAYMRQWYRDGARRAMGATR